VATPPRRTLVVLLGAALLAVAPAASAQDSIYDRKANLDSRISSLRDKIESAKEKEGVLTSEIKTASSDIELLEGDIDSLALRVAELEGVLARYRARLARLEEKYRYQTRHLNRLKRDHARAQRELERRLVELYETDQADALAILLQVESLGQLIEQLDFMNEVGRQDRRITAELKRLKIQMREARKRTAAVKQEVAEATAVVEEKTEEAQAAQAELIARQEALAAARSEKSELLAGTREDRDHAEEDLDVLLAASAALQSQIQSSGSSTSGGGASTTGGDTTPSASGLIWPVSGVVTSGFGYRWGRMHEGIDISAPTGTSVRAAASGTVIIAGYMGGYGNIVVIDHGGGLSTAYAHLSAIWAGGGSVSQGQGIGAVGCTGSCTGPHLHFEVRINGSAVDPMGYL
jgi:murein DD-endopeptidase MepM/ murein hydrolase activator NlpD